MTKEDIAKRYCKFELCTHRTGEGICCLFSQDNCIFRRLEKENAELKAGRPQWHDLRKDPNDLPPKMDSNHNFSIEVLSDRGEIVRYNFHYCEWFYWRSGEPIAWCELPVPPKENE